jgi:hypothetical protein
MEGVEVKLGVAVEVTVKTGVKEDVGVIVAVGIFTVKTAPATGRPVTWIGFPETSPCPVKPVALVEKVPEAVGERV